MTIILSALEVARSAQKLMLPSPNRDANIALNPCLMELVNKYPQLPPHRVR